MNMRMKTLGACLFGLYSGIAFGQAMTNSADVTGTAGLTQQEQ